MDALRTFLLAGDAPLTETINHVWFPGKVSNHDGFPSTPKGLGVDEALDRLDESADAGESAAPDGPLTEDREPGRDLTESAGGGEREVRLRRWASPDEGLLVPKD